MKAGSRAFGIAESYRGDTSTLAGCVTTTEGTLDGFAFGTCRVGGLDATDAMVGMVDRLDREDVQYLFVAGIAPAWFNVVDLHQLSAETTLPVISVSFEESDGLDDAIDKAFDGEAASRRRDRYRSQPDRHPVDTGSRTLYARSVGIEPDEEETVVTAFTATGGRPEPLRIARLAARAADDFRERS